MSPKKGSGVPDRLVWGREDSDLEAEAEAVAEVELDDRGMPSHGFWAHTVILEFSQYKSFGFLMVVTHNVMKEWYFVFEISFRTSARRACTWSGVHPKPCVKTGIVNGSMISSQF